MQYAIELYFDSVTEGTLSALARRVAEEGISSKFLEWKTRPHLTLACFNDVDEAACGAALARFAGSHSALPANLSSVAMFNDTKVVYLTPVMNFRLFQLQRELHQALSGFDTTGWEWYCPDTWSPHCTLALTGQDPPEAFYRAGELILREFRKLSGTFAAVGLVKVTFPVEELHTFPLNP